MLVYEYGEAFSIEPRVVNEYVPYAALVEWAAARKVRAVRDKQAQKKASKGRRG